ncbi:hypothetical protein GCM10010156_49230 [Planobispora rosea]|uniref:YspA cpYpsA-related SLOG domain-containing protein n=1 Tax=Planobispora rosea TaxID=35762 RepID=A0A8J3WDY7_PLARO|nr:SLOG family protein [Planobispora rosea]GGS84744.1 hypothetical protein GCM10010156_49230 [Planobispora rosea]GIH86434.1 hypothetical protein Pro02_48420 [Planobispora rosea]
MLILEKPRVLICGSRYWRWPHAVQAVCERLQARYGEALILIEGAAAGADRACHDWCQTRGWDTWRHRCFPVDWAAEKAARPREYKVAGHERNIRMLAEADPRLIIAFHEDLAYQRGGTSDMILRGLLTGVPVWLVPGPDPARGRWLHPQEHLPRFPRRRVTAAADLMRRMYPQLQQKIRLAA